MRKWMRRLAGAAAALAVLTAGAGALFLAQPEAFLTSRTVGAGLKRLGAGWSPRWSSLRFSAVALGSRRHRYALNAADLCVAERGGGFSACFSEFELSAIVSYSRRGPVVERVERLVAESKDARLDTRRWAAGGSPRALPMALRSTSLDALRVELAGLTFISSATAASGDLRAVLTPVGRRPLAVSADLSVRGAKGAVRLKTEFTADTDLLKGGDPSYVDVVGRAQLGPRRRLRAAFRVRREALRYVASGSAEVDASTGPVASLRLTACEGSAPVRFGKATKDAVLACRYELTPADAASSRAGGLKAVKGGVALSGRLDGRRFSAAVKADIDPIKAWYVLSGNLQAQVDGRLDRPWRSASVTHEVHAAVAVAHFEDLVAFLRETKFAVPAPIHVLKGPLAVSIETRGDPRSERLTATYAFTSELSGARQRLVLKGTGEVAVANVRSPGRSYEHSGELVLKEVALELPRLELIGRPPKVFLDKRIKMDDDPAPAPPAAGILSPRPAWGSLPLRSVLVVRTDKPLILFSNLAKEPVPVTLDLRLAYPPSSVSGRVSVRPFDVELFRRRATVDHMNVALSSGSTVGQVEGLIRYKTPSVMINILIMGTTLKPCIELTSVPPLKREDILALLIFGKDPAELDPEQVASVGNTETALESQAFGLGSLYFFGTTSVERVAYDSATRTASVKVRLPGGADLAFGSDFDQSRQLTLRKLLAPHWALESEVTDQGAQQSMAATTFLEWFNRY
jgi:hypothetical protein